MSIGDAKPDCFHSSAFELFKEMSIGCLLYTSEHRLIEKMIYIINKIINQAESTQIIDTRTIDVVVDFIKTYADKTHHGKEEDILFKDLSEKRMTDEDDKLMKELIEEHLFGRRCV